MLARFHNGYQVLVIGHSICLQGRLNGFVLNSPILPENTKKIAIKVKREKDYGFWDFWEF